MFTTKEPRKGVQGSSSGTSSEDDSDTALNKFGSPSSTSEQFNFSRTTTQMKDNTQDSPEMSLPMFYSSSSTNRYMQRSKDNSPSTKPLHFQFSTTDVNSESDDNMEDNKDESSENVKSAHEFPYENSDNGVLKSNSRKRSHNTAFEEDKGSPKRLSFCEGITIKNTTKEPIYGSKAQKMMLKMGYKEGTGLGRHSQGMVGIIETSKQRGRRGLGLHLPGLETSEEINWQKEEILIKEPIKWMPECKDSPPPMTLLRTWMKEGPKKLNIDDEIEFCSEVILRKVLSCKSVFDELEPEEMRKARTRSNPFETIRGVIFQNRAAMKMANMDAMFDFMFTNPLNEEGEAILGPNDLLYFADICAGPGGFSEYVLFRKKWECKGFGFTLKGSNDFKLEEFFAGPTETFEPYYGVNGINGDGDIYVPENLREFRKFVLENTDQKGVHFVMADGGFSVDGQENIQEILSKQLYLCQFLCALSILRTGGHFVCKIFDLFTPFSVGLVYLLYRAFRRICIVKPNTSRPANSERYVVCQWKQEGVKDIHDYLFEVNCRLQQLKSVLESTDVTEVVPLDILKDDVKFYNYIVTSNEGLGEQQALHLAKIKAFYQNTDLYEERQSELRKECLRIWKIPDRARCAPRRMDPMEKYKELMKNHDTSFFNFQAEQLNSKKLETLKSVYDYRCIVLGVDNYTKNARGFYLGLGKTQVFRWESSMRGRWVKLDLSLEIPNDTLIYAEIVQELKGEGKGQRKLNSLHIIDSLFLGGKDVRDKPYSERITETEKFVTAIYKPSRPDYAPVRMKKVYRFQDLALVFDKLDHRIVKGGGGMRRLCYRCDEDRYFIPQGVLFLKTVNDPWTIAFSRNKNSKYYFNMRTGQSRYDAPKEAVASFSECFSKRLFWTWEPGVKVHDSHQEVHEGKVHRETILEKIKKLLNK